MKYDVSFSEGMLVHKSSEAEKWNLLQKLYKDNYLEAQSLNKPRIPKIIHQIWLGSPFPEKYIELQNTWKKFHPDWEYHLWTDENIKDLKFINREIFDKTENFGAKSDILRYEVLYQFGGLYVDTDFECLKSFDDIHCMCDFYAGTLTSEDPRILIGLIGSSPKNDVIKKNIEEINVASRKHTPEDIFDTTGPIHFTRCFFDVVQETNQKCVIFPSTFFYPSSNSNCGVDHDIQLEYVKNESYAIHYWHISWVMQKKTVLFLMQKAFKYIVPYGLVKWYINYRNQSFKKN